MTWGLDLCVTLHATEKSCSAINRYSFHCSSSFTAFRRVDKDFSRKLVLRAPTKSCLLDPVPTNIMKDCLDELLPISSTMIVFYLVSQGFWLGYHNSVGQLLRSRKGKTTTPGTPCPTLSLESGFFPDIWKDSLLHHC